MSAQKLKRVAIIGLPGSGKSTFAVQLGKILSVPVHHLDKHVFDGNVKRDKQEFLAIKEALVQEKAWIIEGCSMSTLEMRFANADTVIYFGLPRLLCIWRVCQRFLSKEDLSGTGCLEGVNWTLVKYIWNFESEQRPKIETLRKRYPHVGFIEFKKSADANRFLERL